MQTDVAHLLNEFGQHEAKCEDLERVPGVMGIAFMLGRDCR